MRSRNTPPAHFAYWNRLSSILDETVNAAVHLRSCASAPPEKGLRGCVASKLQGLDAASVEVVVQENNLDPEWKTLYQEGALGGFVTYGVGEQLAPWVARKLGAFGWERVEEEEVVEPGKSAVSKAVEKIRVRVWEADLGDLGAGEAERILTERRRMRRLKGRVELCVKILGGLEGRGKRVSTAALEKAKVALEKADELWKREEEKRERAEEREREREKKNKLREEKRKEKERAAKKKKHLEKKKQKNASALFMKKFVAPKTAPRKLKETNRERFTAAEDEEAEVIKNADKVNGVLEPTREKHAMSAAWWLMSQLQAPNFENMDRAIRQSKTASDRLQVSADLDIRFHLTCCAERREKAEADIHRVLSQYRKRRTQHLEDRTPQFVKSRSSVRGRNSYGPLKLLQFDEDYRPAFFGTKDDLPRTVKSRRPFSKYEGLDYSYDSGEEWEDEEDGEDIDQDIDNERENEDAELRRLYGSDEDDDDDFLDDELDGDDDVESLNSDGGPMEVDNTSLEVGDVVKVSADCSQDSQKGDESRLKTVPDPISGVGKKKVQSPRSRAEGPRRKKRKRNHDKHTVLIEGISYPKPGVSSPLDRYSVTRLSGAPNITVFNPYISHISDVDQSVTCSRPIQTRIPRTTLDDAVKLDLALAIHTSSERTSRDAIVYQFCEARRSKGLPVPSKAEIVRTIRMIATNEKRPGDKRAGWYVKDGTLLAKLSMISQRKTKHGTPQNTSTSERSGETSKGEVVHSSGPKHYGGSVSREHTNQEAPCAKTSSTDEGLPQLRQSSSDGRVNSPRDQDIIRASVLRAHAKSQSIPKDPVQYQLGLDTKQVKPAITQHSNLLYGGHRNDTSRKSGSIETVPSISNELPRFSTRDMSYASMQAKTADKHTSMGVKGGNGNEGEGKRETRDVELGKRIKLASTLAIKRGLQVAVPQLRNSSMAVEWKTESEANADMEMAVVSSVAGSNVQSLQKVENMDDQIRATPREIKRAVGDMNVVGTRRVTARRMEEGQRSENEDALKFKSAESRLIGGLTDVNTKISNRDEDKQLRISMEGKLIHERSSAGGICQGMDVIRSGADMTGGVEGCSPRTEI